MKIKILKEPSEIKPFLILDKPAGLPSAPLLENDTNNAVYEASTLYPEINSVHGKKQIEKGLLHRLDTATSGLMIIAVEQTCFDNLIELQKNNKITKFYTAHSNILNIQKLLEGFPNFYTWEIKKGSQITVESMFRPYGPGKKEVRPVSENSGKAAKDKIGKAVKYSTEITVMEVFPDNTCLVNCKITNGFRHQVRCHLAWAGIPVIGDKIYNPLEKDNKKAENEMRFSATKIEFEYPKGDLNSYEIAFTWT